MTIPAASQEASYLALFQNRVFLQLWLGQVVSYGGDALTRIALPILVYQQTGSPLALGAMFAIQMLPWIVWAPWVGVLVDRYDRKRLIVAGAILEGLSVAILALFPLSLSIVYGLALIGSMAQVVYSQARSAVMPDVVGRALYSRAVAVSTITLQLLDVVGALAGGVLVAWLGARAVLSIDAATFFINALTILAVTLPAVAKPAREPWLQAMRVGWSFLFGHRLLTATVIAMALRGGTFIGAIPLLPALVAERNAQVGSFAILTAVASLGLAVGAAIGARLDRLAPWTILLASSLLGGLFLLGVTANLPLATTAVVYGLSMTAHSAGGLVASVVLGTSVPSEIRGRVQGAFWMLVKLAQVGSAVALGAVAQTWGAIEATRTAGLVLVCGMLLVGVWGFLVQRPRPVQAG